VLAVLAAECPHRARTEQTSYDSLVATSYRDGLGITVVAVLALHHDKIDRGARHPRQPGAAAGGIIAAGSTHVIVGKYRVVLIVLTAKKLVVARSRSTKASTDANRRQIGCGPCGVAEIGPAPRIQKNATTSKIAAHLVSLVVELLGNGAPARRRGPKRTVYIWSDHGARGYGCPRVEYALGKTASHARLTFCAWPDIVRVLRTTPLRPSILVWP